ncbi:hypothetical protein OKW29_003660 [Paraburkholderia sp. CI3]
MRLPRAEAAGSFRPLVRRAPYFEHAVHASLQGKIVEAKEVGSHSVMFVETTQIRVRADGDSLIYFDRNFHRVPRAWKGNESFEALPASSGSGSAYVVAPDMAPVKPHHCPDLLELLTIRTTSATPSARP